MEQWFESLVFNPLRPILTKMLNCFLNLNLEFLNSNKFYEDCHREQFKEFG